MKLCIFFAAVIFIPYIAVAQAPDESSAASSQNVNFERFEALFDIWKQSIFANVPSDAKRETISPRAFSITLDDDEVRCSIGLQYDKSDTLLRCAYFLSTVKRSEWFEQALDLTVISYYDRHFSQSSADNTVFIDNTVVFGDMASLENGREFQQMVSPFFGILTMYSLLNNRAYDPDDLPVGIALRIRREPEFADQLILVNDEEIAKLVTENLGSYIKAE